MKKKRESAFRSKRQPVWGAELLERLEADKVAIDPEYLLDCNFCIGDTVAESLMNRAWEVTNRAEAMACLQYSFMPPPVLHVKKADPPADDETVPTRNTTPAPVPTVEELSTIGTLWW